MARGVSVVPARAARGAAWGAAWGLARRVAAGVAVLGALCAAAPHAASAQRGLIPPGFGTLRQEDISLQLQIQGLIVTAVPLEESVIRTLSPDSYAALKANRERMSRALDTVRTRLGLPSVQAWFVTFTNAESGEARYDADDVSIRSAGRDYRPLRILPLKPGFGDGRLAQRVRQSAVYAFDPAVDLAQPLMLTAGAVSSSAWGDITQRIERERALVWSRVPTPKP